MILNILILIYWKGKKVIYKFLLVALEDRDAIEESYELTEAAAGIPYPPITFEGVLDLYDYLSNYPEISFRVRSGNSAEVDTTTVADGSVKSVANVNMRVAKKNDATYSILPGRLSADNIALRNTMYTDTLEGRVQMNQDDLKHLYPWSWAASKQKGPEYVPSQHLYYFLTFDKFPPRLKTDGSSTTDHAYIRFIHTELAELPEIKNAIKDYYLHELHLDAATVQEYMDMWTPSTVKSGYTKAEDKTTTSGKVPYILLTFTITDPRNVTTKFRQNT